MRGEREQRTRWRACRAADQPRVRGERPGRCCPPGRSKTDQPRVRGERPGLGTVKRRHARISPACAGNARAPPSSRMSLDQPRVRGERACQFSQRVRGEREKPGARVQVVADQPRVRGERGFLAGRIIASNPAGSAPRARGTRSASPGRRRGRRISPACAGNALPTMP